MAVHNEHSLRSFPSFCETGNFDEDDDNHFIISLDTSGDDDDDDQKSSNITPSYATACPVTHQPYRSYLNQEATSSHNNVPSNNDAENNCTISNSVLPSNDDNTDISAYQRFIVSAFENTAATNLQPSAYSTSNVNLKDYHHQHSSTGGAVPVSSFGPVQSGGRISRQNEIAVTVSSSIGCSGLTPPGNSATGVTQPSKFYPESVDPQSRLHHKHYEESTQQELTRSQYSDLSKMHLETIHLDKEAGGIWSEAVFLSSIELSDKSFSDIGTDPNENVSFERTNNDVAVHRNTQTSNIPPYSSHNFSSASCFSSNRFPQLPALNHKSSGSALGTECSMAVRLAHFAQDHDYGKTLNFQHLHETTACTCIMCYQENETIKQCQGPYSEEPVLTEEERLLISKETIKRKRQIKSEVNSKKNKALLSSSSNFELLYQPDPTLSVNCPLNENTACTCVMCYKENGIVKQCQTPYSEDPVLTEEERLLIINEPIKRKRQIKSALKSKKNQALLSSSNSGLQYPPLPTLYSNCPRTQSILSDHNSQYSFNHVDLQATQYRDNLHTSSSTLQQSSLTSDIPAHGVLADVLNMNKSVIKPAACEISTTVSSASDVTSTVLTTPLMPRLISAPRFKSSPTKVFLQPFEVLGQRPQYMPPIPELTSINKVNLSNNGRECLAQPTVKCKETQQTCPPSSVTFSNPPNYKIIYVRPDQVLVCPSKSNTSLNVVSLSKQSQKNTQPVAVIKLAQTSTQNKMSPDCGPRASLPSVTTRFSPQLCMSSTGNIQSSSLNPNTQNVLRCVLKNTVKADINHPDEVLKQLKSSSSKHSPQQGVQISQIITPASKSSVFTSLLKDFKSSQVKTTESAAPVNFSQVPSQTSHAEHITTAAASPTIAKPSSREVTQALMCLIKSHFQEPSPASEKLLMNLIKGSVQTSDSNNSSDGNVPPVYTSQQNIKVLDRNISNNLHQITTNKPIEDKQAFKSQEKNIAEKGVMYVNLDTVSSPSLPQEGLPSSYVEDWVNQTKTYVAKHLNVSDCLPEPHSLNSPVSNVTALSHHTAFKSSLDEASQEHAHLKSRINCDMKSQADNQRGTLAFPKFDSQSQLPSSKPTVARIHKLQIVSNSSGSSTVHTSNICQNSIQRQVDQSAKSQAPAVQNVQSFTLYTKTQTRLADSQKPSHSESLTKDNPTQSDVCSDLSQNLHSETTRTASSSSMVVHSAKGIKLKIKLGELRKENGKFSQAYPTLVSSLSNSESMTESQYKGEFSLQKRLNVNNKKTVTGEAKVAGDCTDGDKTETAEEMFQRFQKQAEQEVLKAQMGIGYLSRSLRPARTNGALSDKYSIFDTGQPRKKITSEEKQVHEGSKLAGDNSSCSLSEVDLTGRHNTLNKKSNIRNKRQMDEVTTKEVKLKHPKLSIKDYPRLKEDNSITNHKKLFCSNILAGHKVYVKFNTYENVVSRRTFLVPFFNIGGTRTQFDVEDMDYINTAVLEFEKDERSCARHLLFYAREGKKASFLRKETCFQTTQIDDKNYRKSSFILEGFQRETKKQTDPSSEQWKVDNSIDIEIDRAEIENDGEMEFDADMNYDEVIPGLETVDHVEEGTGHVFNHSEHERFQTKDLQNLCADKLRPFTNQDTHLACVNARTYNSLENHEITDHSQLSSSETCAQLGRISMGDVTQGQLGSSVTSTLPKKGTDESEINYSDAAGVKQEEPDNGYESSIKHLDSTHTNPNVFSTHFSPNTTSQSDQLINKSNVAVKKEPVDEYFDSSAETHPCSSESYQIEHSQPNIHTAISYKTLSCSHISSVSNAAVVHHKPVNFDSAKECTPSSIADRTDQHSPSSHPTTQASFLPGQIAEPCTYPLISRPLITDNTTSAQTEVRDVETRQLELPPKSINTEGLASDVVSDSASASATSVTELSLPESPLPSSSVSVSSEISASSDIDDRLVKTEPDCSTILHSELPVPEFTTEDINKQNSIQSKITSLVESLRHRLTQDTSNLPPWLASTNTEIKKKKRLKINVKNPAVKLPSASPSIPSQIPCSPTVPSLPSSTANSTLDQARLLLTSTLSALHTSSQPADSAPLATICPASLPQDVLKPATCNLPSPKPTSIHNKNPMLLPVIQPTDPVIQPTDPIIQPTDPVIQPTDQHKPMVEPTTTTSQVSTILNDYSSTVGCTSNKLPVPHDIFNNAMHTSNHEANSGVFNSTLEMKPVITFHNPIERCESTLLNIEHPGYSGTFNTYNQSPVDFEIEVGEEDLPETALSLQPIRPNDFATLEQSMDEDDSYQIGHLQPLNQSSTRKADSIFVRQGADRTKQRKQEKYLKDGHNEESEDSRRHEKGSVTRYLYRKFLFSGASHKIKGPRLLHMSANSKAGYKQQKSPRQNASTVNVVSEPITVAELSKSPSVVEIFGASIGKELAVTPQTKTDLPETHISHSPLKSDINEKNVPLVALCQAQITNKKATKRTGKKKTKCTSSGSNLKILSVTPNIAARRAKKPVSIQQQPSHEVKKSDLSSALASSMPLCKVVLTKLERFDMDHVDKLSENVFIIKKTSKEIQNIPPTIKTEEHSDNKFAASSPKSTLRKVAKRRKKKPLKGKKLPVLRPKRDIVDYYASMLENLQKKAQLLEEESRRIAEENARTSVAANSKEMTERKESKYVEENNAEREENCVEVMKENNEEREESCVEVVMKENNEEREESCVEVMKENNAEREESCVEVMKENNEEREESCVEVMKENNEEREESCVEVVMKGINEEMEDSNKMISEKLSNIQAGVYLSSQAAICNNHAATSTDSGIFNEEMEEESNKMNSEKLSNMQAGVDSSSQVAICNNHAATSTDSNTANNAQVIIAHQDCSASLDCERVSRNDKTDALHPTDFTQSLEEKCELGTQSEVNDVADSNWEFLQKFCDETIFNQGSTDYLQKINEEVCFSKTTVARVAELNFGKKDILLGSVSDEVTHSGALGTSEILHEAEDTNGCLEECSDEQERDNLEEDEMLLGLDIPKSSTFGHEDQETGKNPFSVGFSSEVKLELSPIDNENIADGKLQPVKISSEEQVSSAATKDKGSLSSSIPLLAEARDFIVTRGPINGDPQSCEARDSIVTKGPMSGDPESCEARDSIITKGPMSGDPESCEARDSIITKGPMSGDPQSCATTTTHQLKQRNTEVSPSWERLLGYDIMPRPAQKNFSSNPEEATNPSISLVASSNFKCKFKLPKGILSKAIMLSKDMKKVLEGPAKEDSPLSNLEVSTNSSVDQVLENKTNTKHGQSESIRNEDSLVGSAASTCNNEKITPMPFPEFKFTAGTLTAIQKAKAEFLQKKKRGRKPKQRSTVKPQSQNMPAQSDVHPAQHADILFKTSDTDQSSGLNQDSSRDSYQNLQPSSIRSDLELLDLFPGSENHDLVVKESNPVVCSKQCSSESTAFNQISEDPAVQTGDLNSPTSVFHASKTTASNGLHSLKQNRKDGIFSNIDFYHDFADEHTAKLVSEPPSNKEADVDKIIKNSVIDISKLKLKLNPLFTSNLRQKAAHTSVDVLPGQVDNNSVLRKEALPHSSHTVVQDECFSPECVEPKAESCEPDSVNGAQSHDKTQTNSPRPQLLSSPTESPDHISVPTCKPIPQVNATKLCTFLKNFHKNVTTSINSNPEGVLSDVRVSNNSNAAINSSSLLHPTEKSSQLNTLGSTSKVVSNINGRKRKQIAKVESLSQTDQVKIVRQMRKAKEKANQNILTASPTKVQLPGKLNYGHEGKVGESDIAKNEDKGERSFFDCLPSMPLDAWKDKQQETQ